MDHYQRVVGDGGDQRERRLPGPQAAAVALDGCWKAFGSKVALQPTWLRVMPGSSAAVVGANAAGKTTLLRLAAGVLCPSGGERRAVGAALYLAAGDGGRAAQSVRGAVRFAASVGAGDPEAALALAGCEGLGGCRVGDLSDGQRARLTLAVALAAAPPLVCLDEPSSHLDAAGQATLQRVIHALRERCAVLVAATAVDAAGEGSDLLLRMTAGRLEIVR